MLGNNALPIYPQGVGLGDVGVGFQRQKVQGHVDYIFGFLHHLAFCNPEGSLCHGDGEVVDLNAIELSNGHLDGVAHIQHDLSLVKEGDGFVLQPPEGDIGFGEEVPGAAGRVQEFQASQFPLKCLQFGLAGPIYRDSGNFLKLCFQPVQEQRVNDLVDVLNGCVVHPAGAPGFRVQCAFKDSAEDGRRNIAPVEVLAGTAENEVDHFIAQARYLNILVREQTAVDIGECRQIIVQILVPLRNILVQHSKQIDKCPPVLGPMVL